MMTKQKKKGRPRLPESQKQYKQVVTRIVPELNKELEQRAKIDGRTVSDYIRRLIVADMERHG